MNMLSKVIGNIGSENKRCVYIDCRPEDIEKYFVLIEEEFSATENCIEVFYCEDIATERNTELFDFLKKVIAVVIPITPEFLKYPDFPPRTDMNYCKENNICFVPVLLESDFSNAHINYKIDGYEKMAKIYIDYADYSKAEEYCKKCEQLCATASEQVFDGLLIELAKLYKSQSFWYDIVEYSEKRIELCKKAISIIRSVANFEKTPLKYDCYFVLKDCYTDIMYCYIAKKEFESAIKYSELRTEICRKMSEGDTDSFLKCVYAEALCEAGFLYKDSEKEAEAKKCFNEAIKLLNDCRCKEDYFSNLNNLLLDAHMGIADLLCSEDIEGKTEHYLGAYAAASELYKQKDNIPALELLIDISKKTVGILEKNNSSEAEAMYNKTAEYYEVLLALRGSCGDKKSASYLYDSFGDFYKKKKINGKAEACYLRSLELKESVAEKTGESVDYYDIAIVYSNLVSVTFKDKLKYLKKKWDAEGKSQKLHNMSAKTYEEYLKKMVEIDSE